MLEIIKAYTLNNFTESLDIVRIFATVNKSAEVIAEDSSEILVSGVRKEAS